MEREWSVEEVIEALQTWEEPFYSESETKWLMGKAAELLKEQEAKTGAWQWKIHGKPESGGTLGEAVCDQCGKSTFATAVKGNLNYCPNCGARMEDDNGKVDNL